MEVKPKRKGNRHQGPKTFDQSVEDFWTHVRSEDLDSPLKCWEWSGGMHDDGYGYMSFQGKYTLAHRASYIVHHGSIPVGLFVCHHCDNRPCVNPNHLFLGDAVANMRDMVRKGRGKFPDCRGEKQGASILKEADVRDIRSSDKPLVELAMEFGTAYSNIWAIRNRITWRHIP